VAWSHRAKGFPLVLSALRVNHGDILSTIISALDKCSGLLAPEEPFCFRNKVIPAGWLAHKSKQNVAVASSKGEDW